MTDTGGAAHIEQSAESGANPYARPEGFLALLADPDTALGQAAPMPRIGGEPPREFRAFTWGDNATTKGVLKLTPEGAQRFMDDYRRRKHVLCFDYYHSSYNAVVAPDERKAAGQFDLELRSDGLWFTRIQWTPKAAQAIRDGEWPFISPAVLHSKDGVIVQIRNAGLVTDPGLIGAVPTVLSDSGLRPNISDSPPTRKTNMDKKRMVLDAYSATETAMRRCQALADTDGAEMELGNKAVGHMAPLMDLMRAHLGASGMMDDAMAGMRAMAAKDKMMSTLSAELGETDPERLHGKLLAKLLSNAPAPAAAQGLFLSDSDETQLKALLLDGHRGRYPTSKRASLESLPLPGVMTFLSSASDIVPMGTAPREAAPIAPTSANVERVMKDLPKPAGMPNGKPTSLAACTPQQRIQVEAHLDAARIFQGDSFDEKTELGFALTALSDTDELLSSDRIHHMPRGVDPGTGRVIVPSMEVLE